MDVRVSDLPPYGKLFVGLFCILVLIVLVWMTVLGLLHAGIVGYHYEDCPTDNTLKMEAMLATQTPTVEALWDDSGKVIDIDDPLFHGQPGHLSNWHIFRDNLEWAIGHAGTQTMLFFALGLIFMFTNYSDKARKRMYWLGFNLIVLHVIALSGCGFCLPANVLIYTSGPLLLLILAIMTIMILASLRKKN
jgi:hypothetical protein